MEKTIKKSYSFLKKALKKEESTKNALFYIAGTDNIVFIAEENGDTIVAKWYDRDYDLQMEVNIFKDKEKFDEHNCRIELTGRELFLAEGNNAVAVVLKVVEKKETYIDYE